MIALPCSHCSCLLSVPESPGPARVVCSACKRVIDVPPVAPPADPFSNFGELAIRARAVVSDARRRAADKVRIGWAWWVAASVCGFVGLFVGLFAGEMVWEKLYRQTWPEGIQTLQFLGASLLSPIGFFTVLKFSKRVTKERAAARRLAGFNPFA